MAEKAGRNQRNVQSEEIVRATEENAQAVPVTVKSVPAGKDFRNGFGNPKNTIEVIQKYNFASRKNSVRIF